jgi:hypothetical protein
MGGGEVKENGGEDKFKIYCKHFVNATVHPSSITI